MKKINLLILIIFAISSITFSSCKKAEDEKSCYAFGTITTRVPPQQHYEAIVTRWSGTMCDITEEGAKFLASESDSYDEYPAWGDHLPYTETVKGIYKKL